MTIKPLSDHVLLKPLEAEKSKSGIVIAQTAEEKQPEQGEVIAVGPGKLDEKGARVPMEVKVGDKVVFSKYGPDEIELDGTKYLIATADQIKGIIE